MSDPMKTTPTARRVFGATTRLGPGEPGGIGGLDPSEAHRLCTLAVCGMRWVALRQSASRGALVHCRRAASSAAGLVNAMVAVQTPSGEVWNMYTAKVSPLEESSRTSP